MTTYSRYWRKNRSTHKATELALGLRALRKVAGHIGDNVKPVFWRGMVDDDNSAILLDASSFPDHYPIRHKTFDLLTGKVVLHGLASVEWTDWVKDKVKQNTSDLPVQVHSYLVAILDAAEDIYIDKLAEPHIWSAYFAHLWKTELAEMRRDPVLPPSPDSLAFAWRGKSILDKLPDQLHHYYQDPLEFLVEVSSNIKAVTTLATVNARRDRRIELYSEMCTGVSAIISEWEEYQSDPDAVNMFDQAFPEADIPDMEDEEESETTEADPSEGSREGLDPDLAEEINAILEEGETSLTRDIIAAVRDPEAKAMETLFRKGMARIDAQPDEDQVRRLRKVFREQETMIRRLRNRQVRRGLTEGKLDVRRLYRADLDGRVFKHRQAPGSDSLWQICLVADASASMAGRGQRKKPWNIAEKAFVTIAEAMKDFRNRLDIYAYNADKNQCFLTQLYQQGQVFSVEPTGKTPSGQAIMAAATLLKKKYKRNMIIHITDGAANCGLRLGDAVGYCLKNHIDVFTIGCGCTSQTRDFLKESFPPGHVYFLRSMSYLAEGIEILLRKKILSVT